MESGDVFSPLHAPYSGYCAILVPHWVGSFSSYNAVGTNGCLDLSCRSCPQSGAEAIHMESFPAPERDELSTVQFLAANLSWFGCLIR